MKNAMILAVCLVLALSATALGEGFIVGEHIRGQILESPHPYPGSKTGQPEIVWTDYYEYPEAAYIVFEFKKFDLGPGDRIEVRSPYGEQVHTYTGLGYLDKGGDFITKMILGPEAVIELYSSNPDNSHYGYRIERISRSYSDAELKKMYPDSKAICGTDDKQDAKCFETSHPEVYEKSKAVVRIMMDGSALCTGWMVSCENHLITNNHCSWDGDFNSQADLDRMEIQFMYQRPACNSGTATVEYSFVGGTYLENDVYVDYTVFKPPVSEDPVTTYGYINFEDRLATIDEQMFIVGHPAGNPKEISLISTHAQDQSGFCEVFTLSEDPCISGATAPELGYYCDTEGGSSGSPVLSLDSYKAIALHHCADCPNRGLHIVDVWDANQASAYPLPPCTLFNDIGRVDFDREKYGCTDSITITVNDGSLISAGTQDIDVWSDTEMTPETMILTETPADSGTFTGTIAVSGASPSHGDNLLSVNEGDAVTVEYIDADDGQGGVNIPRYDNAVVDCTPPVISNVTVDFVSAYEAQISWTTNEPCDSTVMYGAASPPAETASDDELTTDHTLLLEDLTDCTYYFFMIRSADEAGNVDTDDNGGLYYGFTTLQITILLEANMDVNPNWTYQSQWAWGDPAGASGDPNNGYTGTNVVGYNLNGSYTNNMAETFCTTQSFDCSGATEVFLSYWHWLGIESSSWDHAYVRVSGNGGSTWTTIWSHEGGSTAPSTWSYSEYDISAVAAGSSNVQVRWVMGTTDSSVVYCGWNIDDVLVSYTSECNIPTPTPSGPTPTPTVECLHTGDANLDGTVTAGDAQRAFLIALGSYTPTYEEECAADCNADGDITAGDAQGIFLMALGSGTCADPL